MDVLKPNITKVTIAIILTIIGIVLLFVIFYNHSLIQAKCLETTNGVFIPWSPCNVNSEELSFVSLFFIKIYFLLIGSSILAFIYLIYSLIYKIRQR